MTTPQARSWSRLDERSQGRLAWLMAARVVLTIAVLGVALFLEGTGRADSQAAHDGLYATVGLAFLLTAVYGVYLPRVRRPGRFGALQLATDLALVTSLVHFSGGHESIFSFLYVPAVAYGAIFFHRRGALGAAALAALAHGALLLATHAGLLRGFGPAAPAPLLLARWSVLSGALFLVAFLAGILRRELHRADQALDESASDLRRLRNLHERIVASLTSGLLTTAPDGCITSFNREAERITGVATADAVGRDIDAVLGGARALVMTGGERSASAHRRRMPLRTRRGELLHLGLAASVLRDAEDRPSGWVVIFQDVTEVVRMERELRRKERLAAAGQLAAHLAHEVRNPLAAISGSIQMLRAQPGGGRRDREQTRLMDIVLRETDRLDGLITDFLGYARPAPARPERVGLSAVAGDVLKMFESVRPQGVDVALEIAPRLAALADPSQLRQLLWNLVINASQAMGEGGRLTLSARALASGNLPQGPAGAGRNEADGEGCSVVELRVADTGEGIPPEAMDRIFDPFFTTKRGGSGLGLATVHRIVESNGGALRVESAPGAGTTFCIELPGAEGPA